jgi:uncharacterized protein YegJ (DUF2314 family)
MRIFVFFIVIFFFGACKSDSRVKIKPNQNDSSENLVQYSGEDEKMNRAIAAAKESFPGFLETFKAGCDQCERFSVKLRFDVDEGDGEHIWVDGLHFKEGQLFGQIANEPENNIAVGYGDTVKIRKENLSDWMYIRNSKLEGGYTIKVIYDDLGKKEQMDMENEFGARIR